MKNVTDFRVVVLAATTIVLCAIFTLRSCTEVIVAGSVEKAKAQVKTSASATPAPAPPIPTVHLGPVPSPPPTSTPGTAK